MTDEIEKKTDTPYFWKWLERNASRILASNWSVADDLANELTVAFRSSYPELFWEMTPKRSEPWLFSVSADGIRERFDAVKAAVASAPQIPGLEIGAFRQRGAAKGSIEMNGRRLTTDDVWCYVT